MCPLNVHLYKSSREGAELGNKQGLHTHHRESVTCDVVSPFEY